MKILVTERFFMGANIKGLKQIAANSPAEVRKLIEDGLYTTVKTIGDSFTPNAEALGQICYWMGQIGAELMKMRLVVYDVSGYRNKSNIHIVTGSLMDAIKSNRISGLRVKRGKTISANIQIYIDWRSKRKEHPTIVGTPAKLQKTKLGMHITAYRVLRTKRDVLEPPVNTLRDLLRRILENKDALPMLINGLNKWSKIKNTERTGLSGVIEMLQRYHARIQQNNRIKLRDSLAIRRAQNKKIKHQMHLYKRDKVGN